MRTTFIILINASLTFACCCARAEGGWDYLWGKWEQKRNPRTVFEFNKTNIVVTADGTQEVWKVISGTSLLAGLIVSRNDQTNKASGSVKFDEMIFRLGERYWMLKLAGATNTSISTPIEPNQPFP